MTKKTWFVNRDERHVEYDVPNDVAEHIEDIWELIKFDINCLNSIDKEARKIQINILKEMETKILKRKDDEKERSRKIR